MLYAEFTDQTPLDASPDPFSFNHEASNKISTEQNIESVKILIIIVIIITLKKYLSCYQLWLAKGKMPENERINL